MHNPSLLRFLAAIQTHTETGKTLMASAGYDALELQVAVSAAQTAGFVESTGQIQPSLRLTAAGWAWVAEELKPFKPLLLPSINGRAAS
ncbi:hypothetical protein [Falsiruegeria litorea]|uniref:hypothetical protein n=1 Tax=Falsiruegeria litorea TaxID=1280831 RepID=UPI001BFD7876|nr:hypothetical protein [Falsiruegeria litorea]MBT8169893.1 hypothetical protein [Falsiruegeria litorea]